MAGSRWDDRWQRFPESIPLPVQDGLAISSQRGAMAEEWWSKRFVDVLASYGLGTRMQRGRRYARSGQVVTLEVRPGQLLSQVQGSRRTPYVVTVEPRPLSEQQWKTVDDELASRVVFAARLLAGEVPPELEEVFAKVGVALLPRAWSDVDARCSCPDYENPCKHIAAVLYVFADQLDTDPWLLLTWRGREREQVLAPLAEAGREPGSWEDSASHAVAGEGPSVAPWWPLVPGAVGGADAGSAGGPSGDVPDPLSLLGSERPLQPAAVLDRLDDLDVSVGDKPVAELLAAAYRAVVDNAL